MFRPHPFSTLFPYTTLFRSFFWSAAGLQGQYAGSLRSLRGVCLRGDERRDATDGQGFEEDSVPQTPNGAPGRSPDRKSTRLNSSHSQISYAVFCLKKKKNQE